MGCIPSKACGLEEDQETLEARKQAKVERRREKEWEKARKLRQRVPTPPVPDYEPGPWVNGHRVLTQVNGEYIITEPSSAPHTT